MSRQQSQLCLRQAVVPPIGRLAACPSPPTSAACPASVPSRGRISSRCSTSPWHTAPQRARPHPAAGGRQVFEAALHRHPRQGVGDLRSSAGRGREPLPGSVEAAPLGSRPRTCRASRPRWSHGRSASGAISRSIPSVASPSAPTRSPRARASTARPASAIDDVFVSPAADARAASVNCLLRVGGVVHAAQQLRPPDQEQCLGAPRARSRSSESTANCASACIRSTPSGQSAARSMREARHRGVVGDGGHRDAAFGGGQAVLGLPRPAAEGVDPACEHRKPRPPLDRLALQLPQPRLHQRGLAAVERVHRVALHQ